MGLNKCLAHFTVDAIIVITVIIYILIFSKGKLFSPK